LDAMFANQLMVQIRDVKMCLMRIPTPISHPAWHLERTEAAHFQPPLV